MRWILILMLASMGNVVSEATTPPDDERLRVGVAGHAFDHLGAIGEQAEAAARSGATIIYPGGIGSLGYEGLPAPAALAKAQADSATYLKDAKAKGIRLAIGYVCATSVVKIDEFDRNWPAELRAAVKTKPAEWLQRDRSGTALASWYGGEYRPACMSNPEWRTYEKFIVRQQIEAGHDGIFFDNPTVHPQGCYCEFCMRKFARFIGVDDAPVEKLRALAAERPKDFLKFRGTVAADFLREMREYARTINPNALVTCNNSLNSPDVFFSQCLTYGYNIFEMSKVEDLVVVEDMATQPRTLADGTVIEYGPVYEMLHAISHGKPVVAVTLADGDYHTPANLMRLALAEAAAHGASYLSWPTWPAEQREKMASAVKPQADFLREHAELLNGTEVVADEVVGLDFEKWVETADCAEMKQVRELAAKNVQFVVKCDADSKKEPSKQRVITIENAPRVRAVVRRKGEKTIVHLLNLDIQKVSSFEDRVTPAADVRIHLRSDYAIKSVQALTADADGSKGSIAFTAEGGALRITVPRLVVSTILVVE